MVTPESSTVQTLEHESATNSVHRSLFRSVVVWILAIVCIMALAAIPAAFTIGAIVGNTQAYQAFAEHHQARIEEFLSLHPDNYADITVDRASNGWAYPSGTVTSQADYVMLSTELRTMFGDELAERMMRGVEMNDSN